MQNATIPILLSINNKYTKNLIVLYKKQCRSVVQNYHKFVYIIENHGLLCTIAGGDTRQTSIRFGMAPFNQTSSALVL